jgi:hypothetical protein
MKQQSLLKIPGKDELIVFANELGDISKFVLDGSNRDAHSRIFKYWLNGFSTRN